MGCFFLESLVYVFQEPSGQNLFLKVSDELWITSELLGFRWAPISLLVDSLSPEKKHLLCKLDETLSSFKNQLEVRAYLEKELSIHNFKYHASMKPKEFDEIVK